MRLGRVYKIFTGLLEMLVDVGVLEKRNIFIFIFCARHK